MSDLFKNLKPDAKLHRNGFDLSQRHCFTQVAGELLPTLCIDTVPGDKFEIQKSALARTMPLNTAAFTRLTWYHHFFFVPYSILWNKWDAFITQRRNNYSASSQGQPIYVPSFTVSNLDKIINNDQNTDIFGFKYYDRYPKLLDMLGYGTFNDDVVTNYASDFMNVFRLGAYNKIWYDYYRNSYYDEALPSPNYPYSYFFNFDDVTGTSVQACSIFSGTVGQNRGSSLACGFMFSPKYRQWKKDILTSLLPNTQFGAVSFVSVGDSTFWLTPSIGQSLAPDESYDLSFPTDSNGKVSGDVSTLYTSAGVSQRRDVGFTAYTQDGLGLNFDVLTLRKAEYLQKWKETTLRAGSNAVAQYDAHFGIRPRHTVDHVAQFLGGMSQKVIIDEVVQQSNDISSGTSQMTGTGDIYGKGISVDSDGKITFESTEFGVLMCISSFVPEADYASDGCDRNNKLLEPFDFFTPEFQNIGMEPVTFEEFRNRPLYNDRNTVIGYAPRYWNYKTAKDKIHIGLTDENSVSGLGSWVTPRTVGGFSQGLTRQSLYINPKCLDRIFAAAYDGTLTNEQFLCNIYFDVKAIRPMSVLGLPTF